MNKKQLIDAVTKSTAMSKTIVTEVVDEVLATIQKAVASGDKVALIGFGSFELAHREAREAHNPATGGKVQVAESWKPKFKAGSGFIGLCAEVQRGAAK